jgi:Tfp pilus assembly protein FimT
MVLVLLGVVLAVAFPRIEIFFSGTYLKSASRRLVGTIRYLHDRAASSGKRFWLCYDLDENAYWIEEENAEGEAEEINTVLGRRENLPRGITFLDVITRQGEINSGQTCTLFLPTGYITKSIIHLQNEQEEGQTLVLKGTRGRVMVYEGYIEEAESEDR